MTASKAVAGKKKKEARKVVTFRIDETEHQRLVDYAIALSANSHRRVSNNDAMRHLLRNSKPPSARSQRKSELAQAAAEA